MAQNLPSVSSPRNKTYEYVYIHMSIGWESPARKAIEFRKIRIISIKYLF